MNKKRLIILASASSLILPAISVSCSNQNKGNNNNNNNNNNDNSGNNDKGGQLPNNGSSQGNSSNGHTKNNGESDLDMQINEKYQTVNELFNQNYAEALKLIKADDELSKADLMKQKEAELKLLNETKDKEEKAKYVKYLDDKISHLQLVKLNVKAFFGTIIRNDDIKNDKKFGIDDVAEIQDKEKNILDEIKQILSSKLENNESEENKTKINNAISKINNEYNVIKSNLTNEQYKQFLDVVAKIIKVELKYFELV